MTPVAHEETFMEKAAQGWQIIQPLVDGASKLASIAQPVAGAAAAQSAKVLGAMAQLKISSVPAIKGFEWSAGKVAFGNKEHGGVAQGVTWTLPTSMFQELGGRLTGSLAVSLIPDRKQAEGGAGTDPHQGLGRKIYSLTRSSTTRTDTTRIFGRRLSIHSSTSPSHHASIGRPGV